jgi:hypothetical protein
VPGRGYPSFLAGGGVRAAHVCGRPNRPSGKPLDDTLAYLADTPFEYSPVCQGGPMDPDTLVVLIRNMPDSPQMRHVIDDLQASASLQVLDRLLAPHRTRVPGRAIALQHGRLHGAATAAAVDGHQAPLSDVKLLVAEDNPAVQTLTTKRLAPRLVRGFRFSEMDYFAHSPSADFADVRYLESMKRRPLSDASSSYLSFTLRLPSFTSSSCGSL